MELEGSDLDRGGRPIELLLRIRRADYEPLIEPAIDRTLRLCRETLERARLSSGAVERVILVGGPTITPFVRAAVGQVVGARVDTSLDAITVVAQGAAIFASGQPFPHHRQIRTAGKALARLSFDALCLQTTTSVGGQIEAAPGVALPEELHVRLTRDDQGWQSGFVPVKNGKFICQVSLRENQANTFRLALSDGAGRPVSVEPDAISITHGLSVGNPPLQRTIAVEVLTKDRRGRCVPLITRGTVLPAKETRSFRAAVAVSPGSQDQVLHINVYEGEHEEPEHNHPLGVLSITGMMIQRAIPVNADIDVTLTVDMSRIPSARAYVPILDETYEKVLTTVEETPDIGVLRAELEKVQEAWGELRSAGGVDGDVATTVTHRLVEAGTELGAASGGDRDAMNKANSLIRETRAVLDNLAKATELPRQLEALGEAESEARRVVQKYGVPADHNELGGLERDAQSARERRDARRCGEVTQTLWDLYWRVLFRQDGFWVATFQDLAERGGFTDQHRARALQADGARFLQAHDMSRFRAVVWELWQLVPKEAQRDSGKRVSTAGIKKT